MAVAKPNVGAAALVGSRDWRPIRIAVGSTAVLSAISFLLVPDWLTSWLTAVRAAPHFAPYVVRPGGALLLIALVRWRRPDARAIAATAIIPGTPAIYDALGPLTLALVYSKPHPRVAALVALLSMAGLPIGRLFQPPNPTFAERVAVASVVDTFLIFVPCLLLVLASRYPGDTVHDSDRHVP